MIHYAHGALLTIYGEALGIKRRVRRFLGLRFIESDRSYRKRAMKVLDWCMNNPIKETDSPELWVAKIAGILISRSFPVRDTKFAQTATQYPSTRP